VAKTKKDSNWNKFIGWLMLIAGVIGVIAALMLSIEYINHLRNPHYVPVCNLNPIFICITVSTSSQAHIIGFYNPLLGLISYGAVTAIGVAILAGGKFKTWFWRLVNIGAFLAVAFVTWLQFETLYRIGALCIFCMITWAVTIPLFWYVSLYNLKSGYVTLPNRLKRLGNFFIRHHTDSLLVWFLIIVALILKRFWYFFGNF
jgi:uncharacterized membrane protein